MQGERDLGENFGLSVGIHSAFSNVPTVELFRTNLASIVPEARPAPGRQGGSCGMP